MRNLIKTVQDMHSYCRPAGSHHERAFLERYIKPLPQAFEDPYGNWHVVVGTSRILWSCHTDTVHAKGGRQIVHFDNKTGLLTATGQNCLGADDTAGVFICREMVLRQVPGHYIFHYGEEKGCMGSGDLAANHDEWLTDSFDAAIAFDRRGFTDIITHQMSSRTASEAFAASMAEQLNGNGLRYAASSHGIFTDTAQYEDLIPECSNISIGYSGEHSKTEQLDVYHLIELVEEVCKIDASQLVIARDPTVVEYQSVWAGGYSWAALDDEEHAFKDEICNYCGFDTLDTDGSCRTCGYAYQSREFLDAAFDAAQREIRSRR